MSRIKRQLPARGGTRLSTRRAKAKRFWLCFLAGDGMELGKSKYNGSMELLLLRGWNAGEEMAALRAKTEPNLHEIKDYQSNAF